MKSKTKDFKNYDVITVKYYGATNTKPSKVKLTSDRFNQSIFICFDYHYHYNNINEMAANHLNKRGGYNITGQFSNGLILSPINNIFKELIK